MMNIPNCVPCISGNEIKYLKESIDTGWISSVGPFVDRLEKEFASYHDMRTATAVSSGTAAIHLGLKALNVKCGDIVICPTMTFIASVNPIRYLGAEPVFLGIDTKTLNIDIETLDEFFKSETENKGSHVIYKRNGQPIKAMIVVHLYGNPADMDPIIEVSKKYNVPVLEDATESLGAKYKNKRVGTIGDIGCFSFNGNKIITTGGGGMIISRHKEKTEFCKHLSTQAKVDSFEYIHDQLGHNYRLSNLCAAVGVAQFECLDTFVNKKREAANYYQSLFESTQSIQILSPSHNCYGTYWMILARMNHPDCDYNIINIDNIKHLRKLAKTGLGIRPVWYPIHKLPLYKGNQYFGKDNLNQIYQSTFCLPSSVGITHKEIETTVSQIIKLQKNIYDEID